MDEIQMHDAMSQGLIERGLATPEFAAADRASLVARLNGEEEPLTLVPPAPYATPSAPSQPSGQTPEEADPLMAAAFEGPASPSAYVFDTPYGTKIDTNAFQQELAFRQFFHAEGVPVFVAQEANRLAMLGAANPPSPAQLEQDRQACAVQLAKLYGPDRDANLAIAQREVARMAQTRPEIIDILERTGLGNSPWLVQNLVNLARVRGRAK